MALTIIVIILVIIIAALIIYNIAIYKRLQAFNNMKQEVGNLKVVQDFVTTVGNEGTVEEKVQRINDIFIEQYNNIEINKVKFNIKYSTIVVFDGTSYVIKASNVEEKHWDSLTSLHNEEIFKDSITTAMPKYVTVDNERERLPYQKMEFGRAKSAIFFPLYIDNVYIGYWIIESGEMHAFDKIDTSLLEVVKDNILSIYKSISYQSIIETIPRKDLFTKLNSAEYLYGEGRKTIDKYTISTVAMFRIINLEEINTKYNRETGNEIVIAVAEYIKNSISDEYIFVRYMGPKFLIVFSGVDEEGVENFVIDIKKEIENLKIKIVEKQSKEDEEKPKKKTTRKTKKAENNEETEKEEKTVSPKLNFVLSRYYKGTALENLTKSLEEYIDNADKNESDINNL